jgi:hypothetical protein
VGEACSAKSIKQKCVENIAAIPEKKKQLWGSVKLMGE